MVSEEKYEFTSRSKKTLGIFFITGILLASIGYVTLGTGGHGSNDHALAVHGDSHDEEPYGDGKSVDDHNSTSDHEGEQDHAVVTQAHSEKSEEGHSGDEHSSGGDHKKNDDTEHSDSGRESQGYADSHDTHGEGEAHGEGHGGFKPIKRLYSNLWINSVFFGGIAIIGVFFFAIQYAAQAGWSAGIKRIPMAFGSWLPIAFASLFLIFIFGGHDIFHWTHQDLYHEGSSHFDEIINGKKAYFFWPLHEHPDIPVFWLGRLVIFFTVWYLMFRKMRKLALQEDLESGTKKWYQLRKTSAIFLVFFAVSSSMAAWDWIMSIDTHWFSTMFGWYVFASWWVSGLALTLFLVAVLKDKGYLSVVNANHVHDLGKFVFAFSIFWTYIWFSQFLLIYYAHIPEETVYFVERWKNDHY
ncbi:MAG: hypothetical protein AAGA66_17340, partial [Bacteroidota bacterium]